MHILPPIFIFQNDFYSGTNSTKFHLVIDRNQNEWKLFCMLICMCVLRTIQIKKQRISQYDRNSIILHWNLWKKASNTDIEYKKRMWLDFLLIGHLQWTCVCIWKNCQFHFSCQYMLFFLRNNVYFPVFHWLQCKTRKQVIHLIWICRCEDVISIKQNTAKNIIPNTIELVFRLKWTFPTIDKEITIRQQETNNKINSISDTSSLRVSSSFWATLFDILY